MASRSSGSRGGSARRPDSSRGRTTSRKGGRAGAATSQADARPGSRPGTTGGRPRSSRGPGRGRAKFTGRAVVRLAVVAILVMSYATSFKAYLQQREQVRSLQSQISQRQAEIAALQKDKARWKDPAYVRAQARARLMYVMPGDTGFQVIGRDGKPLDPVDSLPASTAFVGSGGQGWWSTAWESVVIAGEPTDSVLGGSN